MDRPGGRGNLAGQAVCDRLGDGANAVEGIGYKIRDVEVSNFVLPRWFREKVATATRYDYLAQVGEPCTLLPGGYIGLTYDLTTWHVQEPGSGQRGATRANSLREPSRGAREVCLEAGRVTLVPTEAPATLSPGWHRPAGGRSDQS